MASAAIASFSFSADWQPGREMAGRRPMTMAMTAQQIQSQPDDHYVNEVSGEARRAVGQWPTADSLVTQLTEAFRAAADQAGDPDEKGRLRKLAELLGGAGRDIAVSVTSQGLGVKLHPMGSG